MISLESATNLLLTRLTHGPPYEILDKTLLGEHVGCAALASKLPSLRPRLHVFGHIHEAHGAQIRQWSSDRDTTVFANAANWPMGPKAVRPGRGRINFGGVPFQPIIVDLLDTC